MVTGFFEAWNHHDMKAFAELITDDADWIDIVGMHWREKGGGRQSTRSVSPHDFSEHGNDAYRFGIRAATSDVAVAVVTLKAGDFTQDRLSLILVKCEGGWRSRMVTIR